LAFYEQVSKNILCIDRLVPTVRNRGRMTAMLTAARHVTESGPPQWDSQESSISHDTDCALRAWVTATLQIEAEMCEARIICDEVMKKGDESSF
jgi:hypothetical protein